MTLAVLALVLAQANEAEELFRKMEEKLAKAKSLELAWKGEVEHVMPVKMKGMLLLDEGKKLRLEIDGDMGGSPFEVRVVSNGRLMSIAGFGEGTKRVPQNGLNENMAAWLARGELHTGMCLGTSIRWTQDGIPPKEELRVSGFKPGKKEKVGEREAQAVEYALVIAEEPKGEYGATVWIDLETHLPLRRVLQKKEGARTVTITETFETLTLDGKIDASRFSLPK